LISISYSKFIIEERRNSLSKTEKLVRYAIELFPNLKAENICIYFSAREYINDKDALFIPLDHPSYSLKAKQLKIPSTLSIAFAIHLSSREEIDQVFIISHEFEHATQYMKNAKAYLYSCILRDYGFDGEGLSPYEVPTEIAADRKGKDIVLKLYGEDKVEAFIEKFTSCSDINFQKYGSYIRNIKLSEDYLFFIEVMNIWSKYNMDAIIEKLNGEKSAVSKRILEIYEFANK
jgi:hypothetical protein